MVVELRLGVGRAQLMAPCRVVAVHDEPGRRGFTYVTLPGHPEQGEETFEVRLGADATVTAEVSAYSRAEWPLARMLAPATRWAQRLMAGRYLDALQRTARAA